MSVKRVLIAHQSTIPHYRVRFYQEVERLRPNWWDFTVIFDADETRKQFFLELDHETFGFKIKCVRTHELKFGNQRTVFQTFPFTSWKYDLIVVGNSIHNLSYPLSYLWVRGPEGRQQREGGADNLPGCGTHRHLDRPRKW
jgi:hypothetical protein